MSQSSRTVSPPPNSQLRITIPDSQLQFSESRIGIFQSSYVAKPALELTPLTDLSQLPSQQSTELPYLLEQTIKQYRNSIEKLDMIKNELYDKASVTDLTHSINETGLIHIIQ